VDDLTPEARAKILELLEEARREIAADVASTPWQGYQQPKLIAAIDAHMERFGAEVKKELKDDLDRQFAAGESWVDAQLQDAGISVAQFPDISTQALVAMQSDLATRITNLTADATAEIQKSLSLGLLGGKTPFETMELMGRSLTDGGTFSTIARRAEMIVREEFGRTFRKASWLRTQTAAQRVSGLKKQWVHAGHPRVPRPSHVELHGTVLDPATPFQVWNDTDAVMEEAQFPKDPVLSAANSINCECIARPWKESWNLALPELKLKKAS